MSFSSTTFSLKLLTSSMKIVVSDKIAKKISKREETTQKNQYLPSILTSFKFYLDLIKIEFSFQTLTQYAFVGEKLKSVLKMTRFLAARIFN